MHFENTAQENAAAYFARAVSYECKMIMTKTTGDNVIKLFFFVNETARFKNVNNCLNTNIYSYFEKSCGKSYNQYLNDVHLFNTRVK